MTIKELRDYLNELGPEMDDRQIYLQVDEEGNGYNELNVLDLDCCMIEDENGRPDIFSTDWTAEDAGFDVEEDWENAKKDSPAAVLFP